MALSELHCFSKTLDVQVTVNVILPEGEQGVGVTARSKKALPRVLYLLHGYSDDHTIWLRRTSVERYAAGKNLAVVMPAVNHSFYMNEPWGERYWDYVSDELPGLIHGFFRVSDKPKDTYVAGLSMGGYGSMKLALTYPERFAAAASFSGAVDIAAPIDPRRPITPERLMRLFKDPEHVAGSENDLLALARRPADKKPKLLVACGTDDMLFDMHGRFIKALEENNWPFEHIETPGVGHEWAYWDQMVRVFIEKYIA